MPVGDYAEISDLPPALRPGYRPPADVLGDMARGASALAWPASEPAAEHRTGRPLVAQCAPCARVRHSLCELKAGTGPCLCMSCHTRSIVARAESALCSADIRALQSSLREMLILHAQRQHRQDTRDATADPRPPRECVCGCGRMVSYPKRYATRRCRKAAAMRRYRARARAGVTGEVPKAFRATTASAERENPRIASGGSAVPEVG
jgi:hypothetical protein